MIARFVVFVAVWLAVGAATAHAQARPRRVFGARGARAGHHLVEHRLVEPMTSPRRSVYLPWLDGAALLAVPDEVMVPDGVTDIPIEVPEHVLDEPTMPVVSQSNFLADLYRVRPVNGWTWVNLGLGTAGLGIAAAFFRAAGAQATGLQLLQPRQSYADPSAMGDPLLVFGSYSLNYDNLGSLTLQAGLGAVSSTLFRLIYAPSDSRTARYMRTFVTEYQGGWLFGFQGVIF